MEQVASSTLLVEDDGPARGMRRLVVRCGELSFDVFPDRAMDIGALAFRGIPLVWTSPAGLRAPAHRSDSPMGWLDTFSGGLVATCGLDTFGSPSETDGQRFPLHGSIGTQQATHVNQEASWTEDGDYEIRLSGRVRQGRLFGESMELHRTIRCRLGSARIDIHDVVTNLGPVEQPHMVLYHLNLGWPLVDDMATLRIPSEEVVARDAEAQAGVGEWHAFQDPVLPFPEQVFRHRLPSATAVEVSVHNPRLGMELAVAFHTDQLPHLFQWKLLASGAYVLGLEPANSPAIEGRATARELGALPTLAAGETRHYDLSFVVRQR
jgi:hypothetical protein